MLQRVEAVVVRAPDPSCNPFLAFSAQLMAGLDGILNHIEPPEPVAKPGTRRWYELSDGLVNASTAEECLIRPPMYQRARSDRPP